MQLLIHHPHIILIPSHHPDIVCISSVYQLQLIWMIWTFLYWQWVSHRNRRGCIRRSRSQGRSLSREPQDLPWNGKDCRIRIRIQEHFDFTQQVGLGPRKKIGWRRTWEDINILTCNGSLCLGRGWYTHRGQAEIWKWSITQTDYGLEDNLAPASIWHRSQFGTGPIWHQEFKRVNLAPEPIWHQECKRVNLAPRV